VVSLAITAAYVMAPPLHSPRFARLDTKDAHFKEIVMNIKALVTMLVLGSSSVAMARPVTVQSYEEAPIVRDHRRLPPESAAAEGAPRTPPFVPPWVTIGTESRAIDGAMAFRVSPRLDNGFAKGFTTLRLLSAGGKSLISRVEIQFANGRRQLVELNKYLTASSPSLIIDLDGERRSIRKVTVVGRNARQSTFSVQAM
jgi:hypothetical protein